MEPKIMLEKMRKALGNQPQTALAEISESQEEDPFKVLIGTILSHRTRDERTAEATKKLFRRYARAEDLAKAKPEEVVPIIKGVGFYNVKGKRIIEVAKIITERYGGKVPDSIDELLKIPSVGRKTANCVLVYAYKKDAIPVDTHVHRVANRLGIVHTVKPDDTEKGLEEFFPKECWQDVNDLFVKFGKAVCRPVGPKHELCPLTADCEYYKKAAHGGHGAIQ
jgi:endonuclease-3